MDWDSKNALAVSRWPRGLLADVLRVDEHVEAGLSGGVGVGMSVPLFKIGLGVVFVVVWWRYDAVQRGGEQRSEANRYAEMENRKETVLKIYMGTHSKAKSR